MQNPVYTLGLSTNSLYVQDRASWHYCNDCWEYIKKGLTKKNELSDLEKIIEELKDISKRNITYSSPYTSYTISTSGEKIIQAKPVYDGPFTVGCRCENTNKDSLEYK